jgi:hypothetical protein
VQNETSEKALVRFISAYFEKALSFRLARFMNRLCIGLAMQTRKEIDREPAHISCLKIMNAENSSLFLPIQILLISPAIAIY